MARIDIDTDTGGCPNMTVYDVVGAVGADDFIAAMRHRRSRQMPPNTLLDITGACLCHLDIGEIRRTVAAAKLDPLSCPGGRCAIVAPPDTSLKILRLCAAISSTPGPESGSFHFVTSRPEGIAWLLNKDSTAH